MGFIKIGRSIINIDLVARVTREANLDEPDTVTLWSYANGVIDTFDFEQADAVWNFFMHNTPDLNEAVIDARSRAIRIQRENERYAGQETPF